jgi:hypothetical protein
MIALECFLEQYKATPGNRQSKNPESPLNGIYSKTTHRRLSLEDERIISLKDALEFSIFLSDHANITTSEAFE